METTKKCVAAHFGHWMILPEWFSAAVDAWKTGAMRPAGETVDAADDEELPYEIAGNGTAIIPISGAMMKIKSKFGGTSTVMTRNAIRSAVKDDSVKSILLHIDSPGGTVSGTSDLADDVAMANTAKPCFAYIEDVGASAAYWIASQCSKIYANATALVGSIGTVAVLYDTSGKASQDGIKVHVVSTGEFKGAGAPGAPITESQLADAQAKVDALNEHFLAGIRRGRGMTMEQVKSLADGRVHLADKAKQLGLIDEVASLDAAMTAIFKRNPMNSEQIRTYAAEHPDDPAVKEIRQAGYKLGLAEGSKQELERFNAIRSACEKDLTFVANHFAKGSEPETAKEIFNEIQSALAGKEAELATARADAEKAKALAATKGIEPLPTGGHQGNKDNANAIAEFDAKVESLVKNGMKKAKAVAKVNEEDPELAKSYIQAKTIQANEHKERGLRLAMSMQSYAVPESATK